MASIGRASRLMLFASELAALAGKNPYRSPGQGMASVLERNFPEQHALLSKHGVLTEEESFARLLHETRSETLATDSLRAAETARTAADLAEEVKRLDAAVASLPASVPAAQRQELRSEVASQMQRSFGVTHEGGAVAALEVAQLEQETSALVAEAIAQDLPAAWDGVSDEAVRAVQRAAARDLRDSFAAMNELADAGEVARVGGERGAAASEIISKAVRASPDLARMPAARRADFEGRTLPRVRQRVEAAARSDRVLVRRDNAWRDRDVRGLAMGSGDAWRQVAVGGRVDGYGPTGPDGRGPRQLVEIKNRTQRLFKAVPAYEKVQVHAYMYILGLADCKLVQRLKADHSVAQSTMVTFSEKYWDTAVLRPLEAFVATMDWLCLAPGAEERLVALARRRTADARAAWFDAQLRRFRTASDGGSSDHEYDAGGAASMAMGAYPHRHGERNGAVNGFVDDGDDFLVGQGPQDMWVPKVPLPTTAAAASSTRAAKKKRRRGDSSSSTRGVGRQSPPAGTEEELPSSMDIIMR